MARRRNQNQGHSGHSRKGTTMSEKSSSSHVKSVRPEKISLMAYSHIEKCLDGKKPLTKKQVTAIAELAQHLRVFGLLSAVGYIRHARAGEKREQIRPMWTPLLWHLIFGEEASSDKYDQETRQKLMKKIYKLSTKDPKKYMFYWSESLKLSNHWIFWARAYQEED